LPYTTLADWFCITDMQSVYCALRTKSLHNTDTFSLRGLKGHLFKVGLVNSPNCDRCKQASMTDVYILCDCKALVTLTV